MPSHVVTNPPPPGSPEWRKLITPSKIPIILGVSRFKSQFALWHEMAGNIEPDPPKGDHIAWGHDAEDSLVKWWKRHNPGWRTNAGEIAYTNPYLPFPNLATLDRRAVRGRAYRIIECKTARDLNDWGRPGEEDSAPTDYSTQVLSQMGISGIHAADIPVLGGYGAPEIHTVPWDAELWEMIIPRLTEWHESIEAGEPPELSDSVADYQALRGLHPEIEQGATFEVEEKQAHAYLDAVHALDAAKKEAQWQKNQLMQAMGTAQKATFGTATIATRQAARSGPALVANKKAKL